MFNWLTNLISTKVSAIGTVIGYGEGGRARWSGRDFDKFAEEGFRKNSVAFRCVEIIAKAVAQVPICVYAGEKEVEDDNQPLKKLLRRPNPWQSYSDLMETFIATRMLAGNHYLEWNGAGDPDKPGEPGEMFKGYAELFVHRPARIQVIPGRFGTPLAYEYNYKGQKRHWKCDEITGQANLLHLKTFNPLDDWYGLSPVEAAMYAIDQHNAASHWNMKMLQNSARPPGLLMYKGKGLDPAQREKIREDLERKLSGRDNAGRMPIVDGDWDWKSLGMPAAEMEWLEGKKMSAREICLVYGVPSEIANIPGEKTFANYAEARLAFYEDTIIPLTEQVLDALNNWLCPRFPGALVLKPDWDGVSALAPKREKLWQNVMQADWLTVNEKREATGYDRVELKEADALFIASGKLPLEGSLEPPAEVDEDGNPIAPGDKPAEGEDEEEQDEEEAVTKALIKEGFTKATAKNLYRMAYGDTNG